MARPLALSLLVGSLAPAVLSPRMVDAQSAPQAVSLSATVRPYATIEHRTAPTVHRRAGDTTEYRVTVVVRANTSYRIVARRNGIAGSDVTLGTNASRTRLPRDREAVQITRGTFGVTTFEIRYEIAGVGPESAAALTFDVLADLEFR